MENASKALIMAAEILIAVLIVTLAIYAFVYYKDINASYEGKQAQQEIQKFNAQFIVYLGKDVKAQEIVTLTHIAQDYNEQIDRTKKANSQNEVEILVGDNKMTEKDDDGESGLTKFITDNLNKIFTCKNIKYNSQGKVYWVKFSEKT